MLRRIKTWFQNLRAAQKNAQFIEALKTQITQLELRDQIIRTDYNTLVSDLRKEHEEKLNTLVSNHFAELRRFGFCQYGNRDHVRCVRPVRYIVTRLNNDQIVVCGSCMLQLKNFKQIKSMTDLEPPKASSFRRDAYKGESDKWQTQIFPL
jgi:glycyl-tRNA synthetase beta subunit